MSINTEIQRLKDAKSSIKTSIENKGVEVGDTVLLDGYSELIDQISTGGGSTKLFTGNYDTQGLKAIGYDDETIKWYNDNGVIWYEENDSEFKLTDSELAGDSSSTTRFLPTSSKVTSLSGFKKLLTFSADSIYKYRGQDTSDICVGCVSLITVPSFDLTGIRNLSKCFYNCTNLKTIQQLNTSEVLYTSYTFYGCTNLTSIPQLDTSKVIVMSYMFYDCRSLKTIPQLDTSNVMDMSYMFYGCTSLEALPLMNMDKVKNMYYMFYVPYSNNYSLKYIGGFKNLGKAYTETRENYSYYTLEFFYQDKITHGSLMNILNNLYDLNLTYNVAGGGTLYTQQVIIGSTNLAKLTSDEIAIATAKGWTVS